jgi:muramidase (phage lysozyme)
LFQINQDIVPKGYKSVKGRNLAYIITKLGHNIENNDWTTTLQAYPIILESATSTDVWKEWDKNEYPNSISLTAGGTNIYLKGSFATSTAKIASFGKVSNAVPLGIRPFLDTIAYTEGVAAVGQNGYDVIIGNRLIPNWTPNYADGHPNISVAVRKINDTSTAAGRYQILKGIWDESAGNIPFNQANQDVIAYKLLKDKRKFSPKEATNAFLVAQQQISTNSIDAKTNPDFLAFLDKAYAEWASLPNANGEYKYSNQGGEYTPDTVYQIYIDAVKKYSR